MRIEILYIIVVGLVVGNIYTDGKYYKLMFVHKKYMQIAGVIAGAMVVYWVMRQNPNHAKSIVMTSNEYLKYIPMDKNVSNIVNPLLDFTAKKDFGNNNLGQPVIPVGVPKPEVVVKHKRNVSEGKKKLVASRQMWKCMECKQILPATYEIDHKVRLEFGGSNEVENLQALCPSCHRTKTLIESL